MKKDIARGRWENMCHQLSNIPIPMVPYLSIACQSRIGTDFAMEHSMQLRLHAARLLLASQAMVSSMVASACHTNEGGVRDGDTYGSLHAHQSWSVTPAQLTSGVPGNATPIPGGWRSVTAVPVMPHPSPGVGAQRRQCPVMPHPSPGVGAHRWQYPAMPQPSPGGGARRR